MKVLILFGSPKKNGHTAKLLNVFMDILKKDKNQSFDIDFIDTYALNAKPCFGCNFCKNQDACINNDLDSLMASLKLADIVIIASPVYYYSFPAPLKAVIDRLERFYDPSLSFAELKDKQKKGKGILLATAGSSGKFSFDIIKKQANMAFMVLQKEFIGSILAADTDTKGIEDNMMLEVENLYKKLS